MLTVWEYLSNLKPAKRAAIIMRKVAMLEKLYCTENVTDIVGTREALENNFAEWFESSANAYLVFK